MKKIEDITETLEETYKQSMVTSQQKADAMHAALDNRRSTLLNNNELKIILN